LLEAIHIASLQNSSDFQYLNFREGKIKNYNKMIFRILCEVSACQSAAMATRAPYMLNGTASPSSAGALQIYKNRGMEENFVDKYD
jgi:hypothetical protein